MSHGGGGESEGDIELNLAPIVDCFTVLIAYLLVSMSFLSLGFFEAGVAMTGPPPATMDNTPPPEVPISFSIAISDANHLQLKLTGGKTNLDQTIAMDPKDGAFDLDGLKTRIADLVKTYPDIKEANVSADPAVRYKSIVSVIEAVKTALPKVFLADS